MSISLLRPGFAPLSVLAFSFLAGCSESSEPASEPFESASAELEAANGCAAGSAEGTLSVSLLGRYSTGLVDLESSSETAALLRDRLLVTSAEAAALDVVDVADPTAPVLLKRVDLSVYGPSIQSVDISSRGLVAVAVRGAVKTDPGMVVFLDRDGHVLRTVRVGALPDMLVFTHDGRKLLVANEGEPDCYGPGCTDPEGSISIVQVSPLSPVLPVKTVRFRGVALPPGVRVFGPGATIAQDLEPEYITVSKNDRTAYVTLQENNAVAVVDLKTGKLEEIRALGYKDFAPAPTTASYEVKSLPSIGATAAGQELLLGGLSGLFFEGKTQDGKLKFVTHTDRGPNGEATGPLRPFLLPQFAPRIVRLELDPVTGSVAVSEQIPLRRSDGTPLTGLPNTALAGGTPSTAHTDETPIDLFGNVLELDRLGGDFEGVAVAGDGSFWMADEYRPAIYHFDASGKLMARLVPAGSHAASGLTVPAPGTSGELGIEALPGVLGQRRQNRGFEALALENGKIYAMVQSPLRNPETLENSALNVMKNVRLVELDPVTLATRQFIYIMDNADPVGPDDSRADKIGDMTALPGGGFLVIERDDDALPEDPLSTVAKKIYAFNLNGATDVTGLDTTYGGKTLDEMTSSELRAVSIEPISKVLRVDLAQAGYANVEKVEGLAYIDATTLAVINDNDFGVASIAIDQSTGTFTLAPDYVPEPALLGLVTSAGLDASDRDNLINIRNWPLFGMYQPDAIASFRACGENYLVTANEGDARDYDGFAEESRARNLVESYPSILELGDDSELGRLTVTLAPPDGDLSKPYVFGTRSFSIWNAGSGAQIWDSGADFERVTAAAFPEFFNGNNDENSFDNRSDDKGPEPEGVAVGRVFGRTYAFVGLERIGGLMIYDVSVPTAPSFVRYVNSRDFSNDLVGPDSGAEVVRFIPRSASPNHQPLLVVANEISGTTTIWQLGVE